MEVSLQPTLNSMKRKRSPEPAPAAPSKRSTIETAQNTSNESCRLIHLLSQYGLLEALASNLFPDDLYALALSSKAAFRTIFPNDKSRSNLLSKMPCNGKGVAIRKMCHKKSTFYFQFNCIEYAICGTNDPGREVESRPCITCGATTCDECRIHCVYQSIYEPTTDPDDLPNYSGFALLNSAEMGILSPGHFGHTGAATWQDPITTHSRPYHDQGFLDIPLESDSSAASESVEAILDFDLGNGPLELSTFSTSPRPSPVLRAFWNTTERRKRWFCNNCFYDTRLSKNLYSRPACHCTLRARILDRWQCISCYQKEEKHIISRSYSGRMHCLVDKDDTIPDTCGCGAPLATVEDPRILCLWCLGEARNGTTT